MAPSGTGGVAALATTLRQLGKNKRVLMIGAHPDDEDTQLLVLLSRGLGAQAAYLSLTRGEGGQNLIGPELGPELGIIRTEELLAARELDGAGQFFTRAYDFGYSKTADETFRFWPRDSILKDVVAVMRRLRPQIVIAVFSGTPADGHGHHQVSAILARQAFDLLRDSAGGPRSSTDRRAVILRRPRCRSRSARSIRWSANRTSRSRWRVAAGTAPRTWGSCNAWAPRRPVSRSSRRRRRSP